MATYRVVLNGVLKGLEVSQVASQLALVCKIPVEGAMALLASPRMVIKRALNLEAAAMHKAALRSVGCNALIEQEADAHSTALPLAFKSDEGHRHVARSAQDVRQHLSALSQRAKNTVVAVARLAQRYVAWAGEQVKSAKAMPVESKSPLMARGQNALTSVTSKIAIGAQTLAAASRAKKSFRANTLIIVSVAIAAVAIAAFFASSGPSTGGPCPGEYDSARWTNCVGQVNFPSGEKYVGEVRDGQPNGQGTLTWPNGEKYIGEWRDGQRNGQGTFTWPDGAKYVGEFRNDRKHGQGMHTFANGRKYVGEFKDGNPIREAGR
jgi:hypothetical protein